VSIPKPSGDDQYTVPALFEQHEIRRIWHDGRWFFSVSDAIAALTGSKNPSVYWSKLKERMTGEGAREVLTNCQRLKLTGRDGKMYATDCADTMSMLRIVQSVPSPKAEPFKQWLAQVGTERIEEASDPELGYQEWRRRAIASYMARGYSREWAERRVDTITTRDQLTAEWSVRDIDQQDFAVLTDRLHMGAFGLTTQAHKALKGFPVTRDGRYTGELRDGMTITELAFTNLSQALAVEQHQRNDSHGITAITQDIDTAGRATTAAREAVEQITGQPVVSPTNTIPGSTGLWDVLSEGETER
jgi:DNA-damage-inducible protein D